MLEDGDLRGVQRLRAISVDWSIISDDKELDVRGAHLGRTAGPRRSG